MGCCSGRSEKSTPETFQSLKLHHSTKAYFTSGAYSNQITDEDIIALTKARDNCDVSTIVRQLDNDKEIFDKIDLKHPWADPPKSVGSVACAYLIMLFFRDEDLQGLPKQEESKKILQFTNIGILEGISSKLKTNLKSKYRDRQELTVLLLMFLVEDNSVMRDHLKKENFFPEVIQFLGKSTNEIPNKAGLRMACLQFMREIFKRDPEFEEQFCSIGGLSYLSEFVESNDMAIVFDSLNSIDELTFLEDSGLKRNIAIVEKLETVSLLVKLEDLKRKMEEQLKNNQGSENEISMWKNIKLYVAFLLEDFKKTKEGNEKAN